MLIIYDESVNGVTPGKPFRFAQCRQKFPIANCCSSYSSSDMSPRSNEGRSPFFHYSFQNCFSFWTISETIERFCKLCIKFLISGVNATCNDYQVQAMTGTMKNMFSFGKASAIRTSTRFTYMPTHNCTSIISLAAHFLLI